MQHSHHHIIIFHCFSTKYKTPNTLTKKNKNNKFNSKISATGKLEQPNQQPHKSQQIKT